jgi:hypothetical protein
MDIPQQKLTALLHYRLATQQSDQVVAPRVYTLPQPREAKLLNLTLEKVRQTLFANFRPRNVMRHRVDAWDLDQLPQQFDGVENHGDRL